MSEEVQTEEVQAAQPEKTVIVKMLAQRGSISAGEICGWPASRAAELISQRAAIELVVGVDIDEDANPLRDLSQLVLNEDDAATTPPVNGVNAGGEKWVFNAKTDPFTTDGISKQASIALHEQGLHTVDAVRNFIASLPEDVQPVDAINEIDGVTDNQAEKIVKLYGTVTEHSDE